MNPAVEEVVTQVQEEAPKKPSPMTMSCWARSDAAKVVDASSSRVSVSPAELPRSV